MKSRVLSELKKVFRPEMLNRIDETIVFHQLTKLELNEILDLLVMQLSKRISEQGYSLEITELMRAKLLEEGYDPLYGARPMKRALQRLIEDALADSMLGEKPLVGSTLVADVGDDGETMITVKEILGVEPVIA
jgi:ATP-dependent Clp protease ATP-binding subunit ClpC